MIDAQLARRGLITAVAGASALALAACAKGEEASGGSPSGDLMLAHGILRRLAVVYGEAATLVRANFSSVDGRLIARAADFFGRYGHGYVEAKLEEQQVFPQVLKSGGEAASLVPVLIAQHARGQEITAYLQTRTARGAIAQADADGVVAALETFERMYAAHLAYEDTVILPAWRASLGDDAAKAFRDSEKAAFPGGFTAALEEIAAIEQALRTHDLARYTAGPPGVAPPPVIAMPNAPVEGAD